MKTILKNLKRLSPGLETETLKHGENAGSNKYIFMLCVFLAVVTLAVYWNVLFNDFVNYDDPTYVTKNTHVLTGVTWANIKWAFTSGYASNWHPLTWLSLMLDAELFGTNAPPFHITNLLIHIVNTLLLFVILYKTTSAIWRSCFVAGVFALHPVHVESVAWIAERKDVLSTMFWLLTMAGYVCYCRRGRLWRYLVTLSCFALGLMAKPMLVTLPFVLLLLDYWPLARFQLKKSVKEKRPPKRRTQTTHPQGLTVFQLLLEKVPFFVLAAGSSLITFIVQKQGGAMAALDLLPAGIRLCNAVVSYVAYIVKTLLPTNLAVYYPHPHARPAFQVIGAVSILLAISLTAVLSRRKFFVFGWLWYIGTLVPVIGIVQVGTQAMADRYMYVPMIGLLIIIAWWLAEITAMWNLRKIWLILPAGVWLSFLLVAAWLQVGYWQNGFTLFSHALDVTSNNHVAHLNVGNVLIKQGKRDEAIAHYLEALRIRPNYGDAYFNLGLAHFLQGMPEEAIGYYYSSLKIKPDCPKTHYNLANALSQKERFPQALKHYYESLRLEPDNSQVHNNLALTLARLGRLDEAIAHYYEALKYDSESCAVHNNLANAFLKLKKYPQAIEHYQKAVELNPDFAMAHCNMGDAFKEMGKIDEAMAEYNLAMQLDPNDPTIHNGLGVVPGKFEKVRRSSRSLPQGNGTETGLCQSVL